MKQIKHFSFAALAFSAFSVLQAQNYNSLVSEYLNNSSNFKSSNAALRKFIISTEDKSKSLNGTVLQIQQTYNQLPIFGNTASALVQNGKIVHFVENFQKYGNAISAKPANLNASKLFEKVILREQIQGNNYSFDNNSEHKVVTKNVYFALNNELRPSYEFQFAEENSDNYWIIVVDINTGETLTKQNLTLSCNFSDQPYGAFDNHIGHHHNFIGPINKLTGNTLVLAPDNASYKVFPLPIEAPSFGGRSIVSNPWDLNASPEGWHSNGTNSYTYTRGNNVYAYVDANSTNTIGAVAEGGPNRNFDFPLDINTPYLYYQDAALTNLFYMNNKMHDITYKFGFNESARNFQTNNFGKGGAGADAVLAEARDGSNLSTMNINNANFSTPPDGSAGRMQMYLWTPRYINRLFYNSPTDLTARFPETQRASFGTALNATGVTGDLQKTTPADGCSTISEDLTGKIGLVLEGGSCSFTTKVKNAQLKGAIGVVVYNAPRTLTFTTMSGSDSSITIPSILIQNAEGNTILSKLNAGTTVNVTLKDDKKQYIYLDGDLDNGIIAHEYGHGISNRNTGDGYACLSSANANEQMGEGWSDFFALMLTNQPNATAAVPRGIGTFAVGQANDGLGIRPARYSPDFAVNNYTYKKTNGLTTINNLGQTVPHVHSIGFIWATMLWDLHWKYVEKYGYNSDVTANPNSGSAKVFQTVMDGLKLQGCNPSFITGRNAIIAADQASTGGANKCMIWSVFAKRGLGVNANPGLTKPASSSAADVLAAISDQTEDFTVPAECSATAATVQSNFGKSVTIYPNPARNEVYFKTTDQTRGKVFVTIYDASGKIALQEKVEMNNGAVNISKLSNGVYIAKGEGFGIQFTEKIIVKK